MHYLPASLKLQGRSKVSTTKYLLPSAPLETIFTESVSTFSLDWIPEDSKTHWTLVTRVQFRIKYDVIIIRMVQTGSRGLDPAVGIAHYTGLTVRTF